MDSSRVCSLGSISAIICIFITTEVQKNIGFVPPLPLVVACQMLSVFIWLEVFSIRTAGKEVTSFFMSFSASCSIMTMFFIVLFGLMDVLQFGNVRLAESLVVSTSLWSGLLGFVILVTRISEFIIGRSLINLK